MARNPAMPRRRAKDIRRKELRRNENETSDDSDYDDVAIDDIWQPVIRTVGGDFPGDAGRTG